MASAPVSVSSPAIEALLLRGREDSSPPEHGHRPPAGPPTGITGGGDDNEGPWERLLALMARLSVFSGITVGVSATSALYGAAVDSGGERVVLYGSLGLLLGALLASGASGSRRP